MKNLKVLDRNDIVMLVCKHFNVAPSKVTLHVFLTKEKDVDKVEISVETGEGPLSAM